MRILLPFFLLACGSNQKEPPTEGDASDAPEGTSDLGGNGPASDDADTESAPDCDSALGTLSGQVIYDVPWLEGSPVAANAQLIATPTQGDNIRIASNENGQFTTSLPADSYLVMAQDNDGCASDQVDIEVAECGEEALTLRLTECLDGTADGDTAEPSEADTDTPPEDTDTSVEGAHFVASICEAGPSDPYGMSGMAWDGDVLVVSVEYGGCSTGHTFTPCWDGSWDRSMPPGARLHLAHDDADELCMMMLYEDIRIDVSAIMDAAAERTGTDSFQIHLEGHSIAYSF